MILRFFRFHTENEEYFDDASDLREVLNMAREWSLNGYAAPVCITTDAGEVLVESADLDYYIVHNALPER